MDTNNCEYQQALMELYAAVLKVLRLSGSSITDKVKHEELLAKMIAVISSYGYKSSLSENGTVFVDTEPKKTATTESYNSQVDSVVAQTTNTIHSTKNIIGKRYATMAEEDNNEYFFRRTKDRLEESDSNRYFLLTIYDDETGIFEMTDDIVGEKLQMLLDNKATLLAPGVVKTIGTISATCSIITKTAGEVVKRGRSWCIVKPLEIEFR